MAEETPVKNVEEVLRQIEEFEKTINGLTANVALLKSRLLESKNKYGTDVNKWPKE